MPTLIIKEVAGAKFRAGDKVVELQGGCVLNTVTDSDYKEMLKCEKFKKLIDKGFIIDSTNTEKATDDTKQAISDKQTKEMEANERANNVEIKQDK